MIPVVQFRSSGSLAVNLACPEDSSDYVDHHHGGDNHENPCHNVRTFGRVEESDGNQQRDGKDNDLAKDPKETPFGG